MAENLAWTRRFSRSLLKQIPERHSVAMRRRMCSWSEEYLTQVHIKLCTKRALALRTRQSPRRDGRVQAIPAESR